MTLDAPEQMLKSLNESGALTVNESKLSAKQYAELPTNLTDGAAPDVKHFLASLVGSIAEKDSSLSKLSMAEIAKISKDITSSPKEINGGPQHFIDAPKVYGLDDLPDEVIIKLQKTQKSYGNAMPIELALRSTVDLHQAENYRFSPRALIKVLLILGPKESAGLVSGAAAQPNPDAEVLKNLFDEEETFKMIVKPSW